jgi:hypothetical protein
MRDETRDEPAKEAGRKNHGPNMYRRCSVDERKKRRENVDPSEAVEGIDVV